MDIFRYLFDSVVKLKIGTAGRILLTRVVPVGRVENFHELVSLCLAATIRFNDFSGLVSRKENFQNFHITGNKFMRFLNFLLNP